MAGLRRVGCGRQHLQVAMEQLLSSTTLTPRRSLQSTSARAATHCATRPPRYAPRNRAPQPCFPCAGDSESRTLPAPVTRDRALRRADGWPSQQRASGTLVEPTGSVMSGGKAGHCAERAAHRAVRGPQRAGPHASQSRRAACRPSTRRGRAAVTCVRACAVGVKRLFVGVAEDARERARRAEAATRERDREPDQRERVHTTRARAHKEARRPCASRCACRHASSSAISGTHRASRRTRRRCRARHPSARPRENAVGPGAGIGANVLVGHTRRHEDRVHRAALADMHQALRSVALTERRVERVAAAARVTQAQGRERTRSARARASVRTCSSAPT